MYMLMLHVHCILEEARILNPMMVKQVTAVTLIMSCICCGSIILSFVQIFYFPLFQTHYHILPYPKTKENKI